MTRDLEIRFSVNDWGEETAQNEMVIRSAKDIIDFIESGEQSGTVARAAVVNRLLGHADENMLPQDKYMFYSGVRSLIARMVQRQKREVEVKSGRVHKMPAFQGKTASSEDGRSYYPSESEAGVALAMSYLENTVPGHIWNRLLVISHAEGDVQAAANGVKDKIDEMVEKLK